MRCQVRSHYLLAMLMLLTPTFGRGDYLDLKHSASLKAEPRSNSDTIARLDPQTKLILVQDQQENGYYRVKVPDTGQEGWVYRAMGRRYAGLPDKTSGESPRSNAGNAPPSDDSFAVPASHAWGNPTKNSGCRSQNGL